MATNNSISEQNQMITCPQNGNDHNVEVSSEQPRQPRNLQGLLKFAVEATKAEDAPGISELGPLDDERKKFLEEALKTLTVDVAKLLQDAIKVLKNVEKIKNLNQNDIIPSDVSEAFSTIMSVVDDLDVANDFYKLGGFAIFPVCYSCKHPEVKALASNLLAELCQNNPFCQDKALECGFLGTLLNIMENESHLLLLSKSLYAVSCIVREFSPSVQVFIVKNGCAILVNCLNNPVIAIRTKASFLIMYLCSHHTDAKRQLLKDGLVRQLIHALSQGRNDSSVHLLSALHSVISENEVLEQCRDPQLKLRDILKNHLNDPDLVDCDEEKNFCQELLNKF